jgi:DNA-binding LytR/AlgR family response regulator
VTGLHVLAVDDEEPALEELRHLLLEHSTVATVTAASDVSVALHALEHDCFDAVFLDIHLPGLDGLDLARLLRRFAEPPCVVFVTAFDRHAVEAFEVDAVDYLLKPVGSERLGAALARVIASRRTQIGPVAGSESTAAAAARTDSAPARTDSAPGSRAVGGGAATVATVMEAGGADDLAGAADDVGISAGGAGLPGESITIPVEKGGRTRLVERADISVVESEGDYVRLHIGNTSYLVRIPISKLEQEWASAGFIRVHRSFLVNVHHLDELRTEGSGVLVALVAGRELPVSRRGQRTVREFLANAARLGGVAPDPRRHQVPPLSSDGPSVGPKK